MQNLRHKAFQHEQKSSLHSKCNLSSGYKNIHSSFLTKRYLDTICPDATYRSCGVNTTAAYSGTDARFETSRFCSRDLPQNRSKILLMNKIERFSVKETPHPDYIGAILTSYHCNTNGCNIFAGDVVPDGTPALTTTTITTTTSSATKFSLMMSLSFFLLVQLIF